MRNPKAQQEDPRVRILAAALDSFSRKGFAGAATREIARAAEANQGLITYYFGNKGALWQAVVDDEMGHMHSRLTAQLQSGADPGRAVRAELRQAAAVFNQHGPLLRLLAHTCLEGGSRLQWFVAQHLPRLREAFDGWLNRARPHGLRWPVVAAAQQPVLLGAAVTASLLDPVHELLFGDGCASDEERAEALVSLFFGDSPAVVGEWSIAAARRRARHSSGT